MRELSLSVSLLCTLAPSSSEEMRLSLGVDSVIFLWTVFVPTDCCFVEEVQP